MTTTTQELAPQYLLFTEVSSSGQTSSSKWRFILEQMNGNDRFEASDIEDGVSVERMQLLSIIRGLEAIDQPAQVTIVTSSQYVSRGIKSGIQQWRQNDWKWERFGEMIPVRDCDLWKKIQRATAVHRVDCRYWKMDQAIASPPMETHEQSVKKAISNVQVGFHPLKRVARVSTCIQAWLKQIMARIAAQLGQFKLQSPIYRISAD